MFYKLIGITVLALLAHHLQDEGQRSAECQVVHSPVIVQQVSIQAGHVAVENRQVAVPQALTCQSATHQQVSWGKWIFASNSLPGSLHYLDLIELFSPQHDQGSGGVRPEAQ